MNLEALVSKYISSADRVLGKIEVSNGPIMLDNVGVGRVVDSAKAYLEDAKYYREKEKFEVSLTSVAYCEGLLDALRLLGAVKFEWVARMKKARDEE
jgi:FAD synthetase